MEWSVYFKIRQNIHRILFKCKRGLSLKLKIKGEKKLIFLSWINLLMGRDFKFKIIYLLIEVCCRNLVKIKMKFLQTKQIFMCWMIKIIYVIKEKSCMKSRLKLWEFLV